MNKSKPSAVKPVQRARLYLQWGAVCLVLFLVAGCALKPTQPDRDDSSRFEVPRRAYALTPEQETVRRQATTAVEANLEDYLARYIENVTSVKSDDGRQLEPGTGDILTAMSLGPLVISADDMRSLFPQYSASPATRSTHSLSVHEAVTAMAQELYERALAVDDPRGNNIVLFTAGGVASGKTTAMRAIDAVRRSAFSAQIIYDSTMRRYESGQRRVQQALQAEKLVNVVYVFTPIEKSVGWLVHRAVETGRVVPADAAARSHWQAQHTFLKLVEAYAGNPAVSFLLIDNSGEKSMLAEPLDMKDRLYSDDGRFADLDSFIEYTRRLIRAELDKSKREGKLIPATEQAFAAGVNPHLSPAAEGCRSIEQPQGQVERAGKTYPKQVRDEQPTRQSFDLPKQHGAIGDR